MRDDRSDHRPPGYDPLREDPDVIPLHEPIWREMQEPRDGHEPAPAWLIFFFMAVLGWCGWYLGTYDGHFRANVYIEDVGRGAAPAAAGAAVEAVDPMVLGKRIYNNCMACHQKDGQGVAGTYPPLAGSEILLGPPAVPAAIVLHGLEGPITVEGVQYNNAMPAWGHFSDDQIAAVLTFARSSFGNQGEPVAGTLVTAVREATASRTQPWTFAALQDFQADLPVPGAETAKPGEETAAGR